MGRHHRQQRKEAAAKVAGSTAPAVPDPGVEAGDVGFIAATFDGNALGIGGMIAPYFGSGVTLIDRQRFRNNWSKRSTRDQIAACRHYSKYNWFLRPVLDLRADSHGAGFTVLGEDVEYDLGALVDDLVREDLVSSNLVCMWRKGTQQPAVTVLDAERVEYRAIGGIERITLQCSQDPGMAQDKANEAAYRQALGDRMYDAACKGKSLTIIRNLDEEWNFLYVGQGKRSGAFTTPNALSVLDSLDFLELMGVGDWNLAWKRKDVLFFIRKGFKPSGGGVGLNGSNITKDEIKIMGDGFAKVNGVANLPTNHDVDPFYLTLDPNNFDPEQYKTAFNKIMLFGGIEAAVLLGNFSQQNGAAPTLMRNHRTEAFSRRRRIGASLRLLLAEPEFGSVVKDPKTVRFGWSVKSLYSIEEINTLANGLSGGLAGPQTLRALYDLDDTTESELMAEAHKNRENYTPPFERGQGMVPLVFPDELGEDQNGDEGTGEKKPRKAPGKPGRPSTPPAA